jgi:hypothetical protein
MSNYVPFGDAITHRLDHLPVRPPGAGPVMLPALRAAVNYDRPIGLLAEHGIPVGEPCAVRTETPSGQPGLDRGNSCRRSWRRRHLAAGWPPGPKSGQG